MYDKQHPNVVRLCKAFVQHGNQTLFFVHEYHPGAQSVMQRCVSASVRQCLRVCHIQIDT